MRKWNLHYSLERMCIEPGLWITCLVLCTHLHLKAAGRCTRATYEACTSDQPNNKFCTRWNGFVGVSRNIVMKQTPNHQVAGSADCWVEAFEINRTRRTKFMTNIWSANENNLTRYVNLRNCYINYRIWAMHTLYIHGVDVINSIPKNFGKLMQHNLYT